MSTKFKFLEEQEGGHLIQVRAIDKAGNAGEPGEAFIYLDTSPPETPFLSEWQVGSDWSAIDTPFFVWNAASDSGSGIEKYIGLLNGEIIDLGDVLEYQPPLPSGAHTFQVKAVDAVGYESAWSNEIKVLIDLDAPPAPLISSSTHPDPTKKYNDNKPVFAWNAPEDASGILGYYFLFNQKKDSEVSENYFFYDKTTLPLHSLPVISEEQIPLTDGTWYLHLAAQDEVGHLSETAHFRINIETITIPSVTKPSLYGDVNGDGLVNVVDVNCAILVTQWELAGKLDAVPRCVAEAKVASSDLNCDGNVNVSDINLITQLSLQYIQCQGNTASCTVVLNEEVDPNQNGVHDACEGDILGEFYET